MGKIANYAFNAQRRSMPLNKIIKTQCN